MQLAASTRSKIAPHHAIAVQFQYPALGKTAPQRLAHQSGINPGQFSHPQGLGNGVNGLRDNELIRQLRDLTRSLSPHVSHFPSDDLQDRKHIFKCRLVTTGHDREISRLSPDLSTRNRGINPPGSARLDSPGKIERLRITRRSEINHDRPCDESRLQHLNDGRDDIGVSQVETDDPVPDSSGHRRRINRDIHPALGGEAGPAFAAVPDGQFRTGILQMPCHRPAHITEADESDLVSFESFAHVRTLTLFKSGTRTRMKVVITGGGGFLGSQLALKLIERGSLVGPSGSPEPIDTITLFDAFFSPKVEEMATKEGSAIAVTLLSGDMGDRDSVFSAIDRDDIAVFHLASMVSGECEQRFDDAMRANLDGGRYLLEALRQREGRPRLVFASSVAAFGGAVMPDCVSDSTKRTPQTTYGMTKVIGELMINDYSRKGFLDGRSARLPTIIIRPGKPNAAASSWASGMFREPLNGEPCYLPVHRDQLHPVLGYRDVIDSFIALHEADPSLIGDDRAFGLPSHRITVAEGLTVMEQIAAEAGIRPGLIVDDFNPVIQGIVDTWPTATDGTRAMKLGVPSPKPLSDIVRDYIADFLSDRVSPQS